MPITVREAIRDAIAEEMRKDENVFILGEEVAEYQGAYKCTQNLLQEFGAKRVIDSPITEAGFAGLGVGAAFTGLKPIVEFMTFNFAMQAIDQIINSAAKTKYMSGGNVSCPIVFRGPNGSAARVAAQHSQCFASWYAHCPGLKVVCPYTASDYKALLKASIQDPNPIIFLEHELLYGDKYEIDDNFDSPVEIGKAKIVQEGKDITIVGFSIGMRHINNSIKEIESLGISAEIIDLRTLRPLDIDTIINSVKKTNRLLCIEEGWPYAGICSEIAFQVNELAFDYLDAPIARICGEDVPMPYAINLEKMVLPNADRIIQAVKKIMNI